MAAFAKYTESIFNAEIARYIVVGGLITLIDIGVFNLFLLAVSQIGANLSSVARALTFVISVSLAFLLHERVTFSRRVRVSSNVKPRFVLINVLLALLALLPFWVIDQYYSSLATYTLLNAINLVTIGCFTLLRFALYRFVIWQPRPQKQE